MTFMGHRTFSKLIVRVTIGALALAITAIILSVAILNGFKQEIIEKQRGFFGDIVISKNDLSTSYESAPIQLTSAQLQQLKAVPQVVDVSPFAAKAGIMNVKGEVEGVLLKGVDKHYNQAYLKESLLEGDTLDFAKGADQQLLISSYLAKRLNLAVGDKFTMYFIQEPIRRRPFTIQGIYTTHSEELDKTYVIGSLDLIKRLNGMTEDEAGAYQVRIEGFEGLQVVTDQVNNLLPLELQATNIVQQIPDIFNWLDMLDVNDDIIFGLMVIVAVINMASSLLISILERSTMIGVLKALGYPNSGIRQVFLYSAIYLIGIGLLIGNIVALGIYVFQTSTHFFELDPYTYYIPYVPLAISWTEVLLLNGAVVIIGVLTLFIPAMLISRISPIKTIQFK